MTIFECEDTIDGIFTAVYDAWDSRLGHSNVALRTKETQTLELFADYRETATDPQKAEKVARTVRREMGEESYEMIFRAAMARDLRKADSIYRVLVLGLSRQGGGAAVMGQLQNPDVCRVFELSRRVWHEAHRYMGFVRFRELDGGVLFSEIHAESNVLPLIGEHFADRYPGEHFLIYDHARNNCLVHPAGGPWYIALGVHLDQNTGGLISAGEREIQRLFRGFCSSISIRERENRELQRQFLPLKFRKWMTEV